MNRYDQVNIVILTYNYGRFITDAIDSALSQTYPNTMITILDNASDDNTISIVKPYLKKFRNIKYIRNPENLGFIGNIEKALLINTSRYVCFLAADDILDPNTVSTEVSYMKKYDVGVAQTNKLKFEKVRGTTRILDKDVIFDKKKVYRYVPVSGLHISSLIIDTDKLRSVINVSNGFLTSLPYDVHSIDWVCNLLAEKHGFLSIPEFLSFWREHGSNFGKRYFGNRLSSSAKYIVDWNRRFLSKNVSVSDIYYSYFLSSLTNMFIADAKEALILSLTTTKGFLRYFRIVLSAPVFFIPRFVLFVILRAYWYMNCCRYNSCRVCHRANRIRFKHILR